MAAAIAVDGTNGTVQRLKKLEAKASSKAGPASMVAGLSSGPCSSHFAASFLNLPHRLELRNNSFSGPE